MLRTLKNLFKLFILSGKLDLKKSYSTSRIIEKDIIIRYSK